MRDADLRCVEFWNVEIGVAHAHAKMLLAKFWEMHHARQMMRRKMLHEIRRCLCLPHREIVNRETHHFECLEE